MTAWIIWMIGYFFTVGLFGDEYTELKLGEKFALFFSWPLAIGLAVRLNLGLGLEADAEGKTGETGANAGQ